MDGAKDLGLHYQTRIGANSQSPWSQWEDDVNIDLGAYLLLS